MKNIRAPLLVVVVVILVLNTNLWAAASIDYQLHNRSDDLPVPALLFSDIEDATIGDPWVIADQYIRVTYESDATIWRMRIVTDNRDMFPGIFGMPIAWGENEEWDGPPEAVPGSDDIVSYGGLINGSTRRDPNNRAILAWQVFRYNDPYNPPPLGMDVTPPTILTDDSFSHPEATPYDPWGYICDMGDTGYVADPINGYFLVAYGSGAFSLLAQHPIVYRDDSGDALPKPGGGEIVIYIGACLGKNQNFSEPRPLFAGSYRSMLYIQIFHE